MAREMGSEMLRRLEESYGAMSDGELLGLAQAPDDLTETASEVLRGEMTRRNLKADATQEKFGGGQWGMGEQVREAAIASAIPTGISSVIVGSGPTLDMAQPEYGGVEPGESLLGRFHDAIEVGSACGFLEASEVGFRIEDVAMPRSGLGGYDSPPVALNLIVGKLDRERAMAILRKEMGLFPLQEVEQADAVVDDGAMSVVGTFGRREDAEEIARVLESAGMWHRIESNPDGTVENEDAFTLEVKEVDLVRAGEVVEKGMGIG